METRLIRRGATALLLLAAEFAWAGYGGMGNVEKDAGGTGDGIGLMLGCAVLGAVLGYAYCVLRNKTAVKKWAPDGGAVIGMFAGGAILPFAWILLSR